MLYGHFQSTYAARAVEWEAQEPEIQASWLRGAEQVYDESRLPV